MTNLDDIDNRLIEPEPNIKIYLTYQFWDILMDKIFNELEFRITQ
ncbi:hypothetical protein LYNGBM3L_35990 [Moorena producens 3L]|uniref:Uncharacterized protein n=1 Tax=Moorena producens 3L TaxID=489825 RepID=F4XUT7_9CYAN|nr:hypothetical protein LYNGBM3L_35990 [Moorena producens 3L]